MAKREIIRNEEGSEMKTTKTQKTVDLVGQYDHLDQINLPLDLDVLADLLVKSNYGVHRFLLALVRSKKHHGYGPRDRLMKEIERLLEEGE